jgi:hypothetical protein
MVEAVTLPWDFRMTFLILPLHDPVGAPIGTDVGTGTQEFLLEGDEGGPWRTRSPQGRGRNASRGVWTVKKTSARIPRAWDLRNSL